MLFSSQRISHDHGASHAFILSDPGCQPDGPLIARRAASRKPCDSHDILRLSPVHSLQTGALCSADVTCQDHETSPGIDTLHMTSWLLYAACVQGRLNDETLPMSVSLPAGARLDSALTAQAEEALDRSGACAGQLTVEFGEQAVQYAGVDSLLALAALRDAGIGVAVSVSDAAAGLRTICRLPVTCLRLQPRLVQNLPESRSARDAVEQAVGIAHALNASVLGTGTQTRLQRDILADLGADAAGGPLFGPALPAQAFRRALRQPLYA